MRLGGRTASAEPGTPPSPTDDVRRVGEVRATGPGTRVRCPPPGGPSGEAPKGSSGRRCRGTDPTGRVRCGRTPPARRPDHAPAPTRHRPPARWVGRRARTGGAGGDRRGGRPRVEHLGRPTGPGGRRPGGRRPDGPDPGRERPARRRGGGHGGTGPGGRRLATGGRPRSGRRAGRCRRRGDGVGDAVGGAGPPGPDRDQPGGGGVDRRRPGHGRARPGGRHRPPCRRRGPATGAAGGDAGGSSTPGTASSGSTCWWTAATPPSPGSTARRTVGGVDRLALHFDGEVDLGPRRDDRREAKVQAVAQPASGPPVTVAQCTVVLDDTIVVPTARHADWPPTAAPRPPRPEPQTEPQTSRPPPRSKPRWPSSSG